MKVLMLGAGAVGTVSALKFAKEAVLEKLVIADAVAARASALADRLNDRRVTAVELHAADRDAVHPDDEIGQIRCRLGDEPAVDQVRTSHEPYPYR